MKAEQEKLIDKSMQQKVRNAVEERLLSLLGNKKEVEKEIEEEKEEPAKKVEEVTETKKKSDKVLIFMILILVLILIIFFSLRVFTKQQPQTIEDLHQLNLNGKLKPEQGYLYKDIYSFVKMSSFAASQLSSEH